MTSRLVDAGLRASGFWINNMRGQFVKELIFSFFVFTPFGYNLKGKKKKTGLCYYICTDLHFHSLSWKRLSNDITRLLEFQIKNDLFGGSNNSLKCRSVVAILHPPALYPNLFIFPV